MKYLFAILVCLLVLSGCKGKESTMKEDGNKSLIGEVSTLTQSDIKPAPVDTQKKTWWSELPEKDKNFIADLCVNQVAFLENAVDVQFPQTMRQFFNDQIYKKLRGNQVMGYSYDEGFSYLGSDIHFETVKYLPGCESIQPLFEKILKVSATKLGLQINSKSETVIGICVCDCELSRTDKTAIGFTVEFFYHNKRTNRALFRRISIGSNESMEQACQYFAVVMFSEIIKTKKS